jgi:CRISPR system Cascade subunit CasA
MEEQRFNLVEEPWIRVRTFENNLREVSLTQALLQAHTFAALAGETATQDVAVFRLLLAVIHTVFSRVDEDGKPAPIINEGDALRRWGRLWERKQFPPKPIEAYLDKWKDRFWLFDPDRPFFQTEEAKKAKNAKKEEANAWDVAKMNGELVESGNKRRLFPSRTGEGKKTLSYGEAARWLLYLNGWDDNAIKPSQEAKDRSGIKSAPLSWLGQLGYIEAVGDSLFETLMLNLTLLKNGKECWDDIEDYPPSWEENDPCEEELHEISVPNHPAALLTIPFRRVKLEAENGVVCRFYVYSGDFILSTNAFEEQNTVWKTIKGKNGNLDKWEPQTHDPTRQLWRDFSAIASQSDASQTPGVVNWINTLVKSGKLPKDYLVRLHIVANRYVGTMSKTVEDMFSDQLIFHADLLTELGYEWRKSIEEQISYCDKGAQACGQLSKELKLASGGSDEKKSLERWTQQGKALFYDAIDRPFRDWLAGLSAQQNAWARQGQIDTWRRKAKAIGQNLGKQLVEEAGPAAFAGRTIKKKRYAAPISYQEYTNKMNKYFVVLKKKGDEQ